METTESPQISVIVPARNEAKLLPKCLTSLTRQGTKVHYEIIVVDTNSTDGTPEIAHSFGARVINEPRQGKVYAFRSGAEAAQGTILCFVEADCIVRENWIETIKNYLDGHPQVVAISGAYAFHSSTPFYRFSAFVMQPLSRWIYYLLFGSISLRGSNFAIRTSAYRAVGGFAENYLELYDVELGRRVARLGPIHHVPGMKIQTSDRRIRGRLFRFLLEFFPSFVRNILLQRPLPSQTYEDIR
jgi:glycosyltransferase involved in cell wall biosynthesis